MRPSKFPSADKEIVSPSCTLLTSSSVLELNRKNALILESGGNVVGGAKE